MSIDMSVEYLKRQFIMAYYYACSEYARLTGELCPITFEEFAKKLLEDNKK